MEDVLDRVSWLALLGEEEEDLKMSISEWDSLQRNTTLVGGICVQNILDYTVNRAFRIVEYRKEKRRKQEETRQMVEKIIKNIVSRGEKIVEYRRKVEQKKKKESAEYPSVRNWLTLKHPVGNQTAGLNVQDGAKCGNKTESNQTAGMRLELGLGLECEVRTKCIRSRLPNLDTNFDKKFNHNPNSTKPKIKGGKKKATHVKIGVGNAKLLI